MTSSAPLVDTRTRKDISAQLRAELRRLYPGWPESGGAGNALVEVFARSAEILIEQINQVPDRDRIAFLNSLGGALLPPQPASVALTFTLAPGGSIAAVVEAGTQVVAAPAPGSDQPVVFETDTELVVTAAKLDCMFVRTAQTDSYTNLSPLLTTPTDVPTQIFIGTTPLEHMLYIGAFHLFGTRQLDSLTFSFEMNEATGSLQNEVAWEILTAGDPIPINPESDTTQAFSQSGDVVFRNVPEFPALQVGAYTAHWVRCRMLKPVLKPIVARNLTFDRKTTATGLALQAAYTNGAAVDISKDFHPFGERPKFGDTFYVANSAAFGLGSARLTLDVVVTNPAGTEGISPVERVNATGRARVTWDYWNGKGWQELGTMSTDAPTGQPGSDAFFDSTQAFTRSGRISLKLPEDVQPATIAGIKAPWLRARLSANNYGREAEYIVTESKPGTPTHIYRPATLVAPILKSIAVSFDLNEASLAPDAVLAYNDFRLQDLSSTMRVTAGEAAFFCPPSSHEPALYLGFSPPFNLGMPTTPITVYFAFGTSMRAEGQRGRDSQRTGWQYWDGERWVRFEVLDTTGGFLYSGRVTFLTPSGARASSEFGLRRYWLRILWLGSSRETTSPLRCVLENTTTASQTITLQNEVLGSSNGTPGQTFTTSRKPVLEGEILQVFSSERGNAQKGIWNTWKLVTDFHASSPDDTHYALDRLAGTIQFGDAHHGAIPPAGTGNVRLLRYQTGGGSIGNRPAGTIVMLRTTIPYVQAVTNVEAASGGADAETTAHMLDRAPRNFRHRSRAVTVEDYEDLAMLASPDVARARCVPLTDLILDPDARQVRPGVVSVVILPRETKPKPIPGDGLLRRVAEYIEARQSATVQLVLTGPEYVEMDVSAEIGVVDLNMVADIEAQLLHRLLAFMHPLTGGFDKKGWDFGRHPHRSDLLSLLSSSPGVDHVRHLRVDIPNKPITRNFLACPGTVTLRSCWIKPNESAIP